MSSRQTVVTTALMNDRQVKDEAADNVFKSAMLLVEGKLQELPTTAADNLPRPDLLVRKANRFRENQPTDDPRVMDFELATDHIPEDFLQTDLTVDGARHVIFASPEQLTLLVQAKTWYVDGTFKVIRSTDVFEQLFGIHAFIKKDGDTKQVPLVFVFMSRRRKKDYKKVLKKIKSALPTHPAVESFVLDFELAVWNAIRSVFPGVSVSGCVFHWTQAVWKRVQIMDLTLYLVVALTVVLIPYTTCSSYGKLGGDCNGAYVCRRPVRRPGVPYKRVCVRRTNLCDGVKQCPRGDDERSCSIPDIVCPLLNWPANGFVKHDGFTPNDTAIYSCAIGFELTGTATQKCLQTGSWEGSVPTCSPIAPDTVCPLLNWPANGFVKHDGFTPNDTAIYSCAIGFELTGTASRKCLQTGSWEGSVPTCSPIDCGSLPEATNGSFVLTGNSTYGAVAILNCNTNYSVCGDVTYTTCNESGQWTDNYGKCARTDCYVAGRANEYCGKQDVTQNNVPCAVWKENEGGQITDSNFPEGSVTAASNYCRAPFGVEPEPGCLKSVGPGGDSCGIPVCA